MPVEGNGEARGLRSRDWQRSGEKKSDWQVPSSDEECPNMVKALRASGRSTVHLRTLVLWHFWSNYRVLSPIRRRQTKSETPCIASISVNSSFIGVTPVSTVAQIHFTYNVMPISRIYEKMLLSEQNNLSAITPPSVTFYLSDYKTIQIRNKYVLYSNRRGETRSFRLALVYLCKGEGRHPFFQACGLRSQAFGAPFLLCLRQLIWTVIFLTFYVQWGSWLLPFLPFGESVKDKRLKYNS